MAARVEPITSPPAVKRDAWKELGSHYKKIRESHLRELFAEDPQRGERFTAEALGLYFDYSKNRITDETLTLLIRLAEESGLRERIDAMFRGDKINITEKRAVLHVALRAPRDASIVVDGENVVPEVHAVLDRMAAFANRRAQRRVEGPHRQAHSQRHQHRDRRFRPRAGHGLRGSEALLRSRHDVSFCFERRRHRFRRGRPGSRSDGNALYRLLENLHHAGDHDQRPDRESLVCSTDWAAMKSLLPNILSPFRPMRQRWRSSASIPPICSSSGTGSAAAIRWIPPSASRPWSPSARRTSGPCSTASMRWTSTSARRPLSEICLC